MPQLIQLGRDTYEFKEVARLYERTMDHPIKCIQRIQNLDLWEFFCRYEIPSDVVLCYGDILSASLVTEWHDFSLFRKKTQLRKVKRTLDIEERMLFHGTGHSNIQAICTFNFDWRLTGSHGDVYGKGTGPASSWRSTREQWIASAIISRYDKRRFCVTCKRHGTKQNGSCEKSMLRRAGRTSESSGTQWKSLPCLAAGTVVEWNTEEKKELQTKSQSQYRLKEMAQLDCFFTIFLIHS